MRRSQVRGWKSRHRLMQPTILHEAHLPPLGLEHASAHKAVTEQLFARAHFLDNDMDFPDVTKVRLRSISLPIVVGETQRCLAISRNDIPSLSAISMKSLSILSRCFPLFSGMVATFLSFDPEGQGKWMIEGKGRR